MRVWTKRVLAGTIFLLLIIIGAYLAWVGLKREEPEANLEQPPVPVTVLELKKREFTLTSFYNSRLEAVSDVTVIARVRGTVIKDLISEGQEVSKGQSLYRLDDDSYRFAMLQAEAAVELARENLRKVQNISRPEEITRLEALANEAHAGLEKAQSDAERYGELYREGAVSLSQKESVDLALVAAKARADVADENLSQARSGARDEDIASARAAFAQAQAAYNLAKDTWEDTTIRSPISGIVSSKEVFMGDTLEIGMTVCNVVDLSSFRINLGVPGSDVGDIYPGDEVSVSVGTYMETYSAVIEDVGVKADDQTGNFPVILRLANTNPDRKAHPLRAGMDVKVRIVLQRVPDTLVIPTSSLLRDTNATAVFVVENDVASKRAVHLGAADEIEAAVSAGLKPGDLLVVVGQHLLKTGDKVETALAK
jgi:RND family efflux transporter MFP subunit